MQTKIAPKTPSTTNIMPFVFTLPPFIFKDGGADPSLRLGIRHNQVKLSGAEWSPIRGTASLLQFCQLLKLLAKLVAATGFKPVAYRV